MHIDQQHMIIFRSTQQRGGNQQIVFEIKYLIGIKINLLTDRLLHIVGIAHINDAGLPLTDLANNQGGFTVNGSEISTQHFMALHNLTQRFVQHGNIERAANTHRRRHIVFSATLIKLIDKPQAMLREGQHIVLGPIARRNGGRIIDKAGVGGMPNLLHQLFDSRAFKQRSNRKFHTKLLTYP